MGGANHAGVAAGAARGGEGAASAFAGTTGLDALVALTAGTHGRVPSCSAGGAVELSDLISETVGTSANVGDGALDVLLRPLEAVVLPDAAVDPVEFALHAPEPVADGVEVAFQAGGADPDPVGVVHAGALATWRYWSAWR